MRRLAPDLFERRFGDLMEIGRARLPALAPDWTDHNAHDPGITLMELLAWVSEAQLYSLSRRPRRDERIAYAAMFGLTAGGTRPARGLIWPDANAPAAKFAQSVTIGEDAVINVVNEETPTFRPVRGLLFVPGRIQRLETRLGTGGTIDHTATNERGSTPFLPFGANAGTRDVLAMTFRTRGGGQAIPPVRTGRIASPPPVWAIGIRAEGEPTSSPRACRAPLTATLVAAGDRFPLEIVSDTTNGLLETGALLLSLDGVTSSPQEFTIELRSPEGFVRPPRWLHVEPNVIPIVQGRSIARELHEAEELPGWSFTLEAGGLRFAPGQEPVKIEVAEPSGLNEWKRVDHISDSGPGERVFELDAARRAITFGNGVNGRIPPALAQVLASYAVSDAERGNVARNRHWKVAGFEGAFGTNLDAITGGAGGAGSIEQRREARSRSQEEHALVSADDIAKAAKKLPLLQVARAWILPASAKAPRTGAITLVVMRAQGDETRRWLDAVRRQLAARIPLGTRLIVSGPQYAGFSLRTTLVADEGRDPSVIATAVRAELGKRLSLTDRKTGVAVTRRDVAGWLRGVDGVKSIAELRLLDTNGKPADEIEVPRGGLPRYDAASSTVEVRRS
ncbi:MAG TPA: putative baseplate assembly protein [Thermoanaerobaculia bacterium]|nr:putative baseplate assembly protein [Thermoanaerobaculia bacterium]